MACRNLSQIWPRQLDTLYRNYNTTFEREDALKSIITSSLESFLSNEKLHGGPFAQPHMVYSWLLVIADGQHRLGLADRARDLVTRQNSALPSLANAATGDQILLALTDPDNAPELAPFAEACSQRTNVDTARSIRHLFLTGAQGDFGL